MGSWELGWLGVALIGVGLILAGVALIRISSS